jgi:hypothetical protein
MVVTEVGLENSLHSSAIHDAETRNPNIETRNKSKIRNPKFQNGGFRLSWFGAEGRREPRAVLTRRLVFLSFEVW